MACLRLKITLCLKLKITLCLRLKIMSCLRLAPHCGDCRTQVPIIAFERHQESSTYYRLMTERCIGRQSNLDILARTPPKTLQAATGSHSVIFEMSRASCIPIHALTIPHFIDNTLLLSVTTPFRYSSSSQLIE